METLERRFSEAQTELTRQQAGLAKKRAEFWSALNALVTMLTIFGVALGVPVVIWVWSVLL